VEKTLVGIGIFTRGRLDLTTFVERFNSRYNDNILIELKMFHELTPPFSTCYPTTTHLSTSEKTDKLW
jgi:hypothetical protein